MLKYKVNTNNFFNYENSVVVESCEKTELMGELGEKYKLLTCVTDDIKKVNIGNKLLSTNIINVINNTYTDNNYVFEFTNEVEVSGVNKEDFSFSILIDKYIELKTRNISYQYPIYDGKKSEIGYVYFYFDETHYFNNPNIVNGQDFELLLEYFDENGLLHIQGVIGEYINMSTLRVKGVDLDGSLRKVLFNIEEPTVDTVGNYSNVIIKRDNFLYEVIDNFKLYYDRPLQVLTIPFSQSFETNMFQSEAIQTDFVNVEKEKAINKIVDMEKDVYHPVIWDSVNKEKIQDVYQIEFNLHFREHRGDKWTVDSNSYWNGTYMTEDGQLSLMNDSNNEDYGYFSYKTDVNKETDNNWSKSNQSDLLSYLNFTNEDVRYQKNKIKKSFLRLLFYDSTNPTNQNLLYTSTIFFDTGLLFSKYIKHIEDNTYSMITYDSDTYEYENTRQNLGGVRVNREPYDNSKDDEHNIFKKYINDIEQIRLSTQFVVRDKYNSTSSCEGFYVYLFRDYDNGVMPTDLYMKVEFNHAGYGRTVPFMMPFNDNKEKLEQTVKTFKEIVDDWQPNDSDGNPKMDGTDVGYGMRKYLKYSYIHLKYQYDKVNNQHIYYVDDEFYGDLKTSIHDENKPNTIKFNLYEAKISTGTAINRGGSMGIKIVFNVTPSSDQTFAKGGETKTLTVESYKEQDGVRTDLPYTVNLTGGWCTHVKNGNTITLTAKANNGYGESRQGKLVLTQSSTKRKKTINLSQPANELSNDFIVESIVEFGVDGGSKQVNVTSKDSVGNNIPFTVDVPSEYSSWLSFNTYSNRIVFTTTKNRSDSEEPREATVTVIQSGTNEKRIVTITQASSAYVFNVTPNTVYLSNGDDEETVSVISKKGDEFITYHVVDNGEYQNSKGWLVINENEDNITFSVVENTTSEVGVTNLTFIQDESGKTANVTVRQEGAVITYTFTFEDGTREKTLPISAISGNGNVIIYSSDNNGNNVPFTYSINDEYGIITSDNVVEYGEQFEFTFNNSENTDTTDKSCEVTFIQENDSGNILRLIIEQEKTNFDDYIFSFEGNEETISIMLPYNAGTKNIMVYSRSNSGATVDFSIDVSGTNADIITGNSKTEASTNAYTLLLNYGENSSVDIKECLITLTQNESSKKLTIEILQVGDNTVVLPDFDNMVLRYYWTEEDGKDLDTMTVFRSTGLVIPYNNNNITLDGWQVGYGSRHSNITYPDFVIVHGGDNTGSGNESCLLRLGEVLTEENLLTMKVNNIRQFYVDIYAAWFSTKGTGNAEIELTTYKGGSVEKDPNNTYNWLNNGGEMVYNEKLPTNVFAYCSPLNKYSYSQNYKIRYSYVGYLTYNIKAKTAYLTLNSGESGWGYDFELSTSSSELSYNHYGDTMGDFTVVSTKDGEGIAWTATTTDDWITIETTSDRVFVSVSQNTNPSSRNGTVIVTQTMTQFMKSVTITQDGTASTAAISVDANTALPSEIEETETKKKDEKV